MPIDIHIIDPGTEEAAKVTDGAVHVTGSVVSETCPTYGSSSLTYATSSSVSLLTAKTRAGFSIYNHSMGVLYIKMGTTVSTSSFSVALVPNAFYESQNAYSGQVSGIWEPPLTGSAQVTEFTC